MTGNLTFSSAFINNPNYVKWQGDFFSSSPDDNANIIYSTSGGGSFPFDDFENFIIQGRIDKGDVIITNGDGNGNNDVALAVRYDTLTTEIFQGLSVSGGGASISGSVSIDGGGIDLDANDNEAISDMAQLQLSRSQWNNNRFDIRTSGNDWQTFSEVVFDGQNGLVVTMRGHNSQLVVHGDVLDDSSNLIYDQSNNWVPTARLESDSITITAGGGLSGGGSPSLGGSTSLSVDTGRGVELDTFQALQVDEDFSAVWTAEHTFGGGMDITGGTLDMGNNNIEGATRIEADSSAGNFDLVYDSSIQEIRVRDSDSAFTVINMTSSHVKFNRDINDQANNTLYDQTSNHIPQERVEQGSGSGLDADTVDGQEASALGGFSDDKIATDASGTVINGEVGVMHITSVPDNSSLEITQAALLLADGTAAPSNLDLIIGTLDNAGSGTSETNVITGDGSTIYDDQTGSPLASYSNSSGSAQTVFIGIDNGEFNAGSGADREIFATAIAEVV